MIMAFYFTIEAKEVGMGVSNSISLRVMGWMKSLLRGSWSFT